MHLRLITAACCAAVCAVVLAAVATAAQPAGPPPPPTATNGHPVEQVAIGLATPTSFAFGAGKTFAGDAGSEDGKTPGGVFLLDNGTATRLAGSPPYVAGLAWRKDTLYVSAGRKILAWSGWDGTKFTKSRTVINIKSKHFTGFNGLGFGRNGRLYAGIATDDKSDHKFIAKDPYLFDVVSMTTKGKKLRVLASGMRQPWQLAFPKGSNSPFVSSLGQDSGSAKVLAKVPDFVLRLREGQNYGFPACTHIKKKPCKPYAKPFKLFAPHTDVMGLGIIGKTLYMSEFVADKGKAGLVTSMPLKGGKVSTVLQGFVAPVVGLATHQGWLYVGEVGTGQVFRVRP